MTAKDEIEELLRRHEQELPESSAARRVSHSVTWHQGYEAGRQEALSDTLGLLETLAMLGSDPTWKRVSVNFCPETGMFTCLYWKQDALDFTELPRAEVEALLEEKP